ncbi:MAG: glycosyltransferase family 4 protein [Candidatus Omnitrophota bacterium]|nr:glycosyltransferase family 4 protein [Candidatus Omnitrophota bacterium]
MKILLLTTHLNIGGISTYTVSLAKALKANGHEVFVVSSSGMLAPELAQSGVSHINIDMLTKSELNPKVFRAIFEITKIVKRLHIDIIHSQTRITQIIGFFVSKLSGVPLITTCHGFFNKNIGRILLPAWGDRVIAISDAVKENLIDYFGVDKNRVLMIYNGIEIKKFLKGFSEDERDKIKDKFGIKRDHSVIGTVARFTPDKGHDMLLYALFKILKEKPNVQLVFAGDGDRRREIEKLSQRLGLSDNVVFIKPQLSTVNVLAIIDVFMFTPARREGLGLALLEALASGKPVVATNVGGISSVVENNVNGFLVEPSNPALLVEPVLRLLKDKALYARMAQAGKEIVVKKFSINGMVDRTENVYREACCGARFSAPINQKNIGSNEI